MKPDLEDIYLCIENFRELLDKDGKNITLDSIVKELSHKDEEMEALMIAEFKEAVQNLLEEK